MQGESTVANDQRDRAINTKSRTPTVQKLITQQSKHI